MTCLKSHSNYFRPRGVAGLVWGCGSLSLWYLMVIPTTLLFDLRDKNGWVLGSVQLGLAMCLP